MEGYVEALNRLGRNVVEDVQADMVISSFGPRDNAVLFVALFVTYTSACKHPPVSFCIRLGDLADILPSAPYFHHSAVNATVSPASSHTRILSP